MKTVDQIVARFTKTVAELETAAGQNYKAANKAEERARVAHEAALGYNAEAARAKKLAANISKLLEV